MKVSSKVSTNDQNMKSFIIIIITLLTINGLSCENSNLSNDGLSYSKGHELGLQSPLKSYNNKNNGLNDNKDANNNDNEETDDKPIVSSSDSTNIVLSSHPFCKEDIEKLCGRTSTPLNNNLAVLSCIQNDHREEDLHLSKRCHHLIWSYKRNLTNDNRFSSVAKNVCNRLLTANADCLETEHEKVLSPSANLLSCLIEKLDPETDVECKSFLTKMEIIIFSDYRLVHKFTEFCEEDIERLRCGRLDISSQAVHTQGQTIDCLEKSMDKLSVNCKHQILRIAELQSDDFHLDRSLYFACREDREKFCHRIQSGEGKVYRCLMRHKLERDLSRDCREKLFQREMLAVHDYKVAHGLAKACRSDIRKYHCREDTSDQKEIRLAQILLCLENALSKNLVVAQECRSEMLSHRRNLLENYNLTPDLVSACDGDIQNFCSRLEIGGKTLHCLMNHAKGSRRRGAKKEQITEQCRRAVEEVLKEANVGEDWRVDPILQESCQTPVDNLCKDVQPGDGRVLSCLMDHLDSLHMSEDCRDSLLQIQYFVVRDFQLDAGLYRSCHDDAVKHCHAKKDWADKPDHMDPERGPTVLSCLYRYAYHPIENIRLNRQCLYDIRRVMKQRAVSVDLMPNIEEPCLQDLAEHCSEEGANIKKGFEMECLQENYQKLHEKCQSAIGNFTEEESEHFELNYPLFKACATAVKEVCSDAVERDVDQGDIIECLILNKNKAGVKKHHKCRIAIEHFQLLSLKDFRFSFKFKESCKVDVLNYCRSVKTKYDVISCLSGIVFNDTMSNRHKYRISPDCKNQLRVELLQRSESIKLDPILDDACAKDKEAFCVNINAGESQVIECLKSNLHKLTKACQRSLFKRERIELNDNSVDYSLMTNCKSAIGKYCINNDLKDVLFCLRDHRDEIGMDQRCRSLVMKRLAEQNNDYRLNPRLKSACLRDIPKFCAEIIQTRKADELLDGKVIACLKKQYVLNKLSQSCEIEVVNVIREVAQNVELDPILYKSCQQEIKKKCAEDFDVQECLKIKFQNKEITDETCKKQIARLIIEVKADIQSDPLLYKVCVLDLKHYCSDIPVGHGRQLSCLLAAHESSSKLSEECKTMLTKRVEMFEYAAQVAPAESVAEVFKMVATSPSRNYFLFVVLSFISFIFFGGLLCGRVTKRITTSDKMK